MERQKKMIADLLVAAATLVILASAFFMPQEVTAQPCVPGPAEWTEPAEGVGRALTCVETEQEIDPSTSLRSAQDDTGEEFAEDICVPDAEAETGTETEELVDVIPEREDTPATELDALIREAAERYGLPWELVSAVCWAESRYNPDAVSSTPDYGLMQVTQSVMGSYGLTAENWMDPAANLDAGCRILREKLDLSDGDAAAALTRYRFGDAEALAMWSRGEWSNWYSERVLGKYYEIIREGK